MATIKVMPDDDERLDQEELAHLLTVQDGVVSRRQVRELNGTDFDIARMVRRRELATVHPGVYVDHTGPPSWEQRAWAAVLHYWPAALTRESALPGPKKAGAIHVAVATNRNVKQVPRVVVHRTADFDVRVLWVKSPPRVAIEHAAIEVAIAKSDRLEKFHVLAKACQGWETTAAAIAATLQARRRVPDKTFLLELLADLKEGACSVLEREYLELERRHGLPGGDDRRQKRAVVDGRSAYRDVDHGEFDLLVELDGKPFHDNALDRDNDFERDLDAAVTGDLRTVRLTYGQVLRNGCRTVRKVATLLERGGWPGPFVRCPNCPEDLRSRIARTTYVRSSS